MIIIIYKITNLIDFKIYIGQTRKTLQRRWDGHVADSKRCNYRLSNAIEKYGVENFKIEIITQGEFNKALRDSLETHYIRLYNSKHRNIGYNIKDGGDSVDMSQETKDKISAKNKGRKVTENELKIRKQKHIDRYTPEKVEEIRKNSSIVHKGGNNSRALKIVNLETGEIFNCIKDAGFKYNINKITLRWQLRNNKCKAFKYLN